MTVNSFIPILWANEMLEQLWKAQVYASCVNRNYEGEIKKMGDTVRVSTVGPITISSYTTNTVNLTPEVLSTTAQAMNIDQAKYFYFGLDDVDKAQVANDGDLMQKAMKQAAYGIRDATDTFLASTLAAGVDANNTLVSGTAASSNSNPLIVGTGSGNADAYETMVDLSRVLNEANVPPNDRWVVVPPKFVALLLKDPRFTSFATTQAIDTAKAGSSAGGSDGSSYGQGFGMLPTVLETMTGLKLYVSNNVPTSGTGTSTVYNIIAGQQMAASYAEQIAEGNPEAYRLQTGFADVVRSLHLYGAHVFYSSALSNVFVQFA